MRRVYFGSIRGRCVIFLLECVFGPSGAQAHKHSTDRYRGVRHRVIHDTLGCRHQKSAVSHRVTAHVEKHSTGRLIWKTRIPTRRGTQRPPPGASRGGQCPLPCGCLRAPAPSLSPPWPPWTMGTTGSAATARP